MVQILMALAIVIAVRGIVNTLALSVIERTRELGLLRAIGLRRGQVVEMVAVESVLISVFGVLLGVAAVRGLHDQGIQALGLPWGKWSRTSSWASPSVSSPASPRRRG